MKNFYAVIMAGGTGGRFWPMGRKKLPKQLLPLVNSSTMLRNTVDRLEGFLPKERILVMTNSDIAGQIICELPDIPLENIIVEPVGRDTAPCIALAASILYKKDPESIMCVMPADHVITPKEILLKTLHRAALLAQQGYLITLGIPVTSPATGYGYIKTGSPLADDFSTIAEFKEKPSLSAAQEFMQSGQYLWNSGIFLWQSSVIIEEFAHNCPEIHSVIQKWLNGVDYRVDFASLPRISIDYAILEKTRRAAVCRAPFNWDDVGTWKVLKNFRKSDDDGNVLEGHAYTLNASNNLIINDSDCAIAVIGLNHIAVIKSGNGLLVCDLDSEQKVKELARMLPGEFQ
ncbi:MAG: mannose-1-phosphate guanyltransferase [Lentisphaerae bacterium]|nr:mannose-1-phosphate guanyltransferase [Lentisphaerota bacterium]